MQLIFWHNLLSPHQAPFMRELAGAGHEVVVIATEAMSQDRRNLGWEVPSLGQARVILGPNKAQVMQIVESSGSEAIHLIAGARSNSLGRQVALACRASGRRMGIITESPDSRGLGGPLRWTKYAVERFTLGGHFDFILAMGLRGVRWFKHCGYSEARIFPFAYVTERLAQNSATEIQEEFQFLFVGQLISRKGVDLLLKAMRMVPNAILSVIGDGSESGSLQALARSCGVEPRILWLGKMNAAQVQARIFAADVLVLPSREDGWGAVVNESLMAGTPVICSTACGAADLIRQPWLGTVFQANRVVALAQAMKHWSVRGKVPPAHRQRVRHWAQCIEAPSIASYVESVLAHVYDRGPRPQVPWQNASP